MKHHTPFEKGFIYGGMAVLLLFSRTLSAQGVDIPGNVPDEVEEDPVNAHAALDALQFWSGLFKNTSFVNSLRACYALEDDALDTALENLNDVNEARSDIEVEHKQDVQALAAAKEALATAKTELDQARSVLENAKFLFDNLGPPENYANHPDLKVEAAAAVIALAKAKDAVTKAQASWEGHRATVEKLEAATTASEKKQTDTTDLKTIFKNIDDVLINRGSSPKDFENMLNDDARKKACLKLDRLMYQKLTQSVAPGEKSDKAARKSYKDLMKMIDTDRVEARVEDVLRKATGTSTAASGESPVVEGAGTPDRTIAAVMTSLGAASKTQGTQAVLTLNLGSLSSKNETDRLKKRVFLRNLFLRAILPITSTEGDSQSAGEQEAADTNAESSNDEEASTEDVYRFSMMLGSSFLDDSDPRLEDNDECYRLVRAYVPFPIVDEGAPVDLFEDRKDYLDVCHRIAANKTRIAWRLGVGFLTDRGENDTDVELLSGALVWAPTSWVYFNALYQRLFQPEKIHNVGGGISLSRNFGGQRSAGQDAWLRIGIDFLALFSQYEEDDRWDSEYRFLPTAKLRLAENLIFSFGVGPQIVGKNSPGILSIIALSYDADKLIMPLMSPMSE